MSKFDIKPFNKLQFKGAWLWLHPGCFTAFFATRHLHMTMKRLNTVKYAEQTDCLNVRNVISLFNPRLPVFVDFAALLFRKNPEATKLTKLRLSAWLVGKFPLTFRTNCFFCVVGHRSLLFKFHLRLWYPIPGPVIIIAALCGHSAVFKIFSRTALVGQVINQIGRASCRERVSSPV